MWTEPTRRKYDREGQRDASDLTDAEWALIEPHMPAKHLGRRACDRIAQRARFCISRGPAVSGECGQRSSRPSPRCKAISTTGATTACLRPSIFTCCYRRAKRAGRGVESVLGRGKAATRGRGQEEQGAQALYYSRYWRSAGWGRGGPADIHDRDGAVLVIETIHQLFPWLRHLFADSVYNGPNLDDALAKFGTWTIEIVKRAADATGFKLLPSHWIVERRPARLNRNRRLAKDSRRQSRAPRHGLCRLCAAADQKTSLTCVQQSYV
jgi:transposase